MAIIELFFAPFTLSEMHALDEQEELTPMGRVLAKLPMEPRLGKMIILGSILL